jgi:hypothetical protein
MNSERLLSPRGKSSSASSPGLKGEKEAFFDPRSPLGRNRGVSTEVSGFGVGFDDRRPLVTNVAMDLKRRTRIFVALV